MENKTVYVLGAGFSKEAGFPLTWEFTNREIIAKFRENLDETRQKRLDEVSDYFLERIESKYCEDGIESVLNHIAVADYLDMEATTNGIETYPSKQIFQDLLWYITRLLKDRSKQEIPSEYRKFVKYVHDNNFPIISFNYDMIVEKMLHEIDAECDYGVDTTPIDNGTLLMKMHGSVNWTYCNQCKQFVFYSDYEAPYVLESKSSCPTCKKSDLEAIIIPPILYKDTFYKHPRYENLIRQLWGFANDELVTANKVVFIGFSMAETDAYAQELFKFSSNMNKNAKYEIVTTLKAEDEMQQLKDRYEKTLVDNKVKMISKSFCEYVREL